jgi:hypothetical protein
MKEKEAMKPNDLWSVLTGTTFVEAGKDSQPTRVLRRGMPQRLRELLETPEGDWSPEDRNVVQGLREVADALMKTNLLSAHASDLGIGFGVTKEAMVCIAAFATPVIKMREQAGGESAERNMLDHVLANVKVL